MTPDPLDRLVPPPVAPVRLAPAPRRELGPLARLVALGSARVTGGPPLHVFRVLGRHPGLFRAWLAWSGRVGAGRALGGRAEAELVILRVAFRTGSGYEWRQHVRVGRRAGLTDAQIARCADANDEDLGPRRTTVLRAVDELLADRRLTDATWRALRVELGDRGVVELCLLVGQYQGLATALGGLGVPVED